MILNEISLSQATINELARAFAPYLRDSFWTILSSLGVLIAAFFAAYSAFLQKKVAKAQLLDSIHQRFFEILSTFPMEEGASLTKHNHQLLGNYYDYIALLIRNKRLKVEDIDLLQTLMIKDFEEFGKKYREDYGNVFFDNWHWLFEELS